MTSKYPIVKNFLNFLLISEKYFVGLWSKILKFCVKTKNMAASKNVDCIGLIEEAIRTKTPIRKISENKGVSKDFIKDKVKALKKKKIKTEEDIELLEAYDRYSAWYQNVFNGKSSEESYSSKQNSNNNGFDSEKPTAAEMLEQGYDPYQDEKYEERSIGEELRENKNDLVLDPATGKPLKLPNGKTVVKITRYHYKIFIKNEEPLEGYFTREEMATVYRLYSNLEGNSLTVRAVSRQFPDLTYRDFKRIIRAFNLTKQSVPVPPHILLENTDDKVVEIITRNTENRVLKKLETERSKNAERMLEQVMKELVEVKKNKSDLKEIFSTIKLPETKPFKIVKKKVKEERAMSIFLSDQHVGNCVEGSIYDTKYDEKVFAERMEIVANQIQKTYNIYGRFDKIIINNLGDSGDGVDEQTARKGHYLQQNLNDRQQFTVYMENMIKFFDTIHKMDVANNVEFNSVGESNHWGDQEFIVNQALKYVFNAKYPEMEVRVFDKFIEDFSYGNHQIIMTHGKDKMSMKRGLPLILNDKTELYFEEYIRRKHISKSAVISVIKGDLHQSALQFGKNFRYKNCLAMTTPSSYIQINYGLSSCGVDYEILDKNAKDYSGIVEGRILF